MNKYLIIFVSVFISCHKGANSGIIPQFKFTSPGSDRISTYYIYDYVSENDLISYSQKENHNIGKTSIYYYFSHNANIPSIDLRQAESIIEIKKIMKGYAHSLKYVFVKKQDGEESLNDCISNPRNPLCLSD
tara:strand:- start:912 stop:1307 length:396 start_codon:yes stop_codon:yes gene_type:complete